MSSLQGRARRAGLIYVVMSVIGAPTLIVLPKFVVANDPAATAQKIAASEQIYRLLMLGGLAGQILFLVLGWSLYHLFEEVDRKQATLLLLFVLASSAIGIIDIALLSPPLILQHGATFLSAFTPQQIDALALGFLKIRNVELTANEALWGLWLVPFGMLVIKSGFIPKFIGVLLLVASVGYVAMSAASIGFPAYAASVERVGMKLIQCELVVILWLVIKGARDTRSPSVSGSLPEAGGAVPLRVTSQ